MITVGDSFGSKVAEHLGMDFIEVKRKTFPDGEVCPRLSVPDKLIGQDVLLAMVPSRPYNPNSYILELLITIRNLKSYGANHINLIVPYFPYARQDRIIISGEPLSSKFVKEILKVWVDNIFSVELHNEIDGIVNIDVSDDIANYLKSKNGDILIGPDKGSGKLLRRVAKKMGMGYITMNKTRNPSTGSISINFDYKKELPKEVILLDDILSSGGTMKMAADMLRSRGVESIVACVVHPTLVGNWKEINADELVATNTIPSEISAIDVTETVANFVKKKLKL